MKYTYLFLFVIIPFIGFGQRVTISEDISIRNDRQYEVLGKLKDRFLIFRDKTNEYVVQAFDMNMRLSWDKEIELEKKRVQLTGVFSSDDHFYVFFTFKKKNNYYMKMHQYDAGATLIDSITIWDYGARAYPPNPQILCSQNKKKILIHQYERQSEMTSFVYDIGKQKTLWNMKFKPNEFNAYRDLHEWVINDKGEAFFVVGLNNRKARKENHHYLVYHCSPGEVSPAPFPIPMEGQLTYDVEFTYDNLNDKLVMAGLYSEKNRGKANGCFYTAISLTNLEGLQLNYKVFEQEFMAKVMEVDEAKELKGIDNVDVKDIVLRQDGGILLVSELSKEFERRMASASRGYVGSDGSRYIVDYYNDDLFVLSIHPDGQMHWESILHKKQYSQDDKGVYSSYFMMKTPSALRFLFNDDIKNENTVSEYIVEGDGTSDRNSVMSTANQDIQLRFKDAVQFGPGELLIPSERRYRLRLVKLEF